VGYVANLKVVVVSDRTLGQIGLKSVVKVLTGVNLLQLLYGRG